MKSLYTHLFKNVTPRTATAVILGNIICGFGIAILRFSMMGNDPYTASTLAISTGLGIGLGNYQLALNIILLIVELIWGRKYIGFGTIINMCLLGYIVQFSSFVLTSLLPSMSGASIILKLIVLLISLLFISFGLAMYQVANLGVSPYDFLALGMTDALPTPYFLNRMITDTVCVLIILGAVFTGLIGWGDSNLGIGTIICMFGLGPFIDFFTPWNKKRFA